jgi:hypothetical protein
VYLAETVPSGLIKQRFFYGKRKNSDFLLVLAKNRGRNGKKPDLAHGIGFFIPWPCIF